MTRTLCSLAFTLLLLTSLPLVTMAQISITDGNAVTENFNSFDGSGFAASPAAGQLDSDNYLATGFSDGDGTFGGSHTTGDFARGTDPDGVTTGGVYAFETTTSDFSWGVQPGGSDFTPGTFVVRYQNNTGSTIIGLTLTYEIKAYNDQNFATSFNLSHASSSTADLPGDGSFTSVASADFTTTETADGSPAWTSTDRNVDLTGLSISNGDYIFIRFTSDDVSGSGSRDQVALDDLSLTANINTQVQFTASSQSQAEGDAGTSTVTVTASITNPSGGSATTVEVAATGGTATGGGDDYTYSTATLTFPAGSSANQSTSVTLNGDTVFENDETIILTLQNASGGTSAQIGSPSTQTVTITNDDAAALVINEIHPDPDATNGDANGDATVSSDDDEFVEIVNTGSVPVDMSNYTLEDGTSTRHTFPANTILAPGGVITVFGGGTPATSINGIVQTTGTLSLNNTGDTVTLKDDGGTTLDTHTYNGTDGSADQSLTRSPDKTGGFAQHSTADSGDNSLFSPGDELDDDPFPIGVALADGAGWRMLAAPSANVSISDLAAQNQVQGITGGDNAGSTANIYTSYTTSWQTPSNVSDEITVGKGFIWYFWDNDSGTSNALPATLNFDGQVTTADVDATGLTGTETWHLLGNPYGVPFDLSQLNLTGQGFQATVQIWNPTAGSYQTVTQAGGTTDLIAAGQGFFVERSSGTNTSLTFTAAGQTTTTATFYGKGTPQRARLGLALTVTDEGGLVSSHDEAASLYFHPQGDHGWDAWDASKLNPLKGTYATLALLGTRDDQPAALAQDARPYALTGIHDFPLTIDVLNLSGTFTLTWPTWDHLPEHWTLTLLDHEADTEMDLRTTASYAFSYENTGKSSTAQPLTLPAVMSTSAADASLDDRFTLRLDAGLGTDLEAPGSSVPAAFALAPAYPNPFNPTTTLRFSLPASASVQLVIYDLLGREVARLADGHLAAGHHRVQWHAVGHASGTYLVRLTTDRSTATQAILLVK